MASSSLSLEKHEIEEKYDVFLSFRGEDTRNTFASYLYAALSAKQMLTFMDPELERGDEIAPTLRKAIEESKISVIIFSEKYASSTWCLDELVHILECKKTRAQVVMPIFYGIDPSVVRKQKESFGAAFAELEERFKGRMEKVHQWRAALTEASNLCGLDSKDFRPDNKLVKKIVEDISLKLPKCLSFNYEHVKGRLIGIEKYIKEIESRLSIGTKDVRIVGIWGMGGIGKTTLASVVFQRLLYFQFEGYSFLWNVREEYSRHGPNRLRKKLLSELLSDESILRMDTPFVASPFIHDKLRRKKVLIVLDDVDSLIQLEALVEGYDHFALGSRIIVTTRNVQVLKKVAADIYKVEGLNQFESLELFNLHAFGKSSPPKDYEMLSNNMISYADGNPLALKVLGSSLRSKSTDEWESALNKLKKIPNKDILDVLRISYEGLDKGDQNLFLDIACLIDQSFSRDDAENMLDAGDSSVKIGLTVLIEKSLVESRKANELWMHDLLRQVGRTIVCDEHREPGKRSRLWDVKDVCHVLERNTGTAAVEGISFNMSEISKDVKLCHAAFSEMYNLRILKIYCDNIDNIKFKLDLFTKKKFKLDLPQGLGSYLSDNLRYLRWDLYPLKSLPSNFSPENLVELILSGSHVQKLWNNHEVKSLPVLRRIDLRYSKFLTQLPDLSTHAPNLESINLEGCTSLVQVLSSIQNLDKLTYLNLNGCSKLRDFQETSKRTEGYLYIVRFGGIKNVLNNFTFLKSRIQSFAGNLCLYSSQAHISQKFAPNLRCLLLRETAIETVPPSIVYLSGLVQLDLSDCTRLKSLPTSICHLKSLEKLYLSGCEKLKTFPEILEPMEHLTVLWLDNSGFKELPESIENLVSLKDLDMGFCKDLESLPDRLCNLRNLQSINFMSSKIQKLPSLPPSLLEIAIGYCKRLKSLPEVPSQCLNMYANGCTSLENISNWRAPLLRDLHNTEHRSIERSNCFYGCEKLDQNTRNMFADYAEIYILSCFTCIPHFRNGQGCCYPGDEIPKWFNYQTCGTSINNIMLPPDWNSHNFLGFAFCVVFRWNKIANKSALRIRSELNFKTIDDDSLYQCDHGGWFCVENSCLDHVYILHMDKYSLISSNRNMESSKEMVGLYWPSTCSTEASFQVYPTYRHYWSHDYSDMGSEYGEIKKFGVQFVYKEDMERCDAETERKNKRRFNECCESGGSEAVGSLEEEDDDESHSKKLKLT